MFGPTTALALGLASLAAGVLPAPQAGKDFEAPDRSLSCLVPAGWRARTSAIGGTAVHVLEPEGGGEERILVSTGLATASTIQELAQQTIALVTQQLMPGLQAAAPPVFTKASGFPAAELSYRGVTVAGPVVWWQGVVLKDKQYATVLGGARSERAQAVEKECRAVFGSIKIAPVKENAQLAQVIVGRWTWFNRSNNSGVSTSKQVSFYANGRFDYNASTFVPNLPSGVDPTTQASGTFRIQGNTLLAQFDNGQQATFTLELVPGGGLKINGELFIRE
jgi:hypothetical protein